ncbi:hypothetical protein LSCM1_01527 [Leishmania martiniquensis]|uniref:Uncharacterized protein n=1 Tax=Leishmania martiniquensis TaxID=1580590 RepID=A0A836KCM3_9TRYP|nr:hypothetical protein LSCM1_01527 [Leishmania martiniquensis]
MGITCARGKEVVTPSSVKQRGGLSRRRSHVRKKRRSRNVPNGVSSRHTSVAPSRADACTECDDLCGVPPARNAAAVAIAGTMKGEPLPLGAEKTPPKPSSRRDSGAQTTAPLTEKPSALRYPMYRISDDADSAGYAVTPFKSTYCLQRTMDVEPDSFRALVTHSHAATPTQPSVPTVAHKRTVDDRREKSDSSPPKAVQDSECVLAARVLSRPSLGGLRHGFSFGVLPDGADDPLTGQADKVSFTSIFESGLILQPESLSDSVSGGDASSIFPRATNGTDTDESSNTARTSHTALSRQHTFGFMMPTGHSQVVDSTEDGGTWAPAAVSPGTSPDVRQTWWQQKSIIIASSAAKEMGQTAALRGHGSCQSGCCVDRHPHRAKVATAVPPCPSPRRRSKVGRQWPQPLMEGPKGVYSRSRPFNVEATLGCSVRSARFVPSPDWERVDAIEEEQLRLAQSLKAYKRRLAEWERAQAAHLQTLSL